MSLITSGLKNYVILSDGLPSLAKLVVSTSSAYNRSCITTQGCLLFKHNMFLISKHTVVFVSNLTCVIGCFPGVSKFFSSLGHNNRGII